MNTLKTIVVLVGLVIAFGVFYFLVKDYNPPAPPAPTIPAYVVGGTYTLQYSILASTSPTVSVYELQRVDTNPDRYEIVATLAKSIQNTGSYEWTPDATGTDVSIEIGCVDAKVACNAENPVFNQTVQ
jgi:hypothetical protein